MAAIVSRSISHYAPQYFHHIKELPIYYTKLASELSRQTPLMASLHSFIGYDPKVLFTKDRTDAKICEVLSKTVCGLAGNKSMLIYSFPHDLFPSLFDPSNKPIQRPGIAMGCEQTIEDPRLLEDFHLQIFSKMSAGWKSATPENYPDIRVKEDPEQFAFYIKKRSVTDEDQLILLLAEKFSLSSDVKAYSDADTTYLWVRKSALASVKEKLGLQLE